jgi:hypothetical protein
MSFGNIVAIIEIEREKINPALTLYRCTILQNSFFFSFPVKITAEAAKRGNEAGKWSLLRKNLTFSGCPLHF